MELHSMWENCPTLSKELTRTLEWMEETVRLKNRPIEQAIREAIHAGGKLLRPACQLLLSWFGPEQDRDKTTALVASIEVLHTATLIHDDIADEVDLRRGQPNIRSQFGNIVSVYTKDYLLVCCFRLLSDYSTSLKSLQLDSRSMKKVLNGESGRTNDRCNCELSVKEYLKNISDKTAGLFQLSCSVGTFESGTNERFAKKAGNIGLSIEMTFQIIDDILDYTKESQEIGKPVLEGMRQRIYSLPLIYSLQKNEPKLLPYLRRKAAVTEENVDAIHKIVEHTGDVGEAKKLAASYTEEALKEIEKLPATSLRTKENLLSLTQLILGRKDWIGKGSMRK